MPKPTVPFRVLRDPAPQARLDRDGPVVRANFLVSWDDAFRFANEAMGYVISPGGTTIVRVLPWQYPDLPAVFCRSVQIVPIGAPQGVAVAGVRDQYGLRPGEYYTHARVEVEFGVPSVQEIRVPDQDPGWRIQIDPQDPIPWVEMDIEHDGEVITYAEGTLVYKVSKKVVPFRSFRRIGVATWMVRIPQLPFMPWPIWRRYIKHINDRRFLGEPERTVMFDSFRTSSIAMTDGTVQKRAELRFLWRELPWDEVIRPEDGLPEQVEIVGTADPLYRTADLRDIFRVIGL